MSSLVMPSTVNKQFKYIAPDIDFARICVFDNLWYKIFNELSGIVPVNETPIIFKRSINSGYNGSVLEISIECKIEKNTNLTVSPLENYINGFRISVWKLINGQPIEDFIKIRRSKLSVESFVNIIFSKINPYFPVAN